MRICIICEGSYPYVVGGVSSWIDSLIRLFPQHEFVILAVMPSPEHAGQFAYILPENVREVREAWTGDADRGDPAEEVTFSEETVMSLVNLLCGRKTDWDPILELFGRPHLSLNRLLMGPGFLDVAKRCYESGYTDEPFTEFLWNIRSICLPLFSVLGTEVPKAYLYHSIATGYSGVLGALGKHRYGGRLLISEHGIYTREREEEIIKAKWVKDIYKDLWIRYFRSLSRYAYESADCVTSLFEHARELQEELGCPVEKQIVTPNGIDTDRFRNIPGKTEEDRGWINVGAVARVSAIKDVKTMLRAFALAKGRIPALRLYVMGPTDEDPEYAGECFELVRTMEIQDVFFTGRVNVTDYLGRMDFMLLTSISEGQPLTILEGFAAKKPVIATDVGNCRGLISGERDSFGAAGIVCHIMNTEEIGNAIAALARDPELVRELGENGYRRVTGRYRIAEMQETYRKLYEELGKPDY